MDFYQIAIKNEAFKPFKEEEVKELIEFGILQTFQEGETIYSEDQPVDSIYLLLEGNVNLVKNNQLLGVIESGQVIGEVSLSDNVIASVTMKATNEVKALKIPVEHIHAFNQKHQSKDRLYFGISNLLNAKIRKAHKRTADAKVLEIQEKEKRHHSVFFFTEILFYVVIFVFLLQFLILLKQEFHTELVITLPLLVLMCIPIYYAINHSKHPPSFYGLTLKNWKKNLWEGVYFSLYIMAGYTLLKYIAIQIFPIYQGVKLFDFDWAHNSLKVFFILLYVVISSPFQEFITRGVIQSFLQEYLSGKYRVWKAIIFSNLLFAFFHISLSRTLAVFVFITGLFWGWLYARQRSLVGVIASHILIGFWCLVILNAIPLLTLIAS